jgi:DNA-directed RNA polymerase specialized sigma24 family protein
LLCSGYFYLPAKPLASFNRSRGFFCYFKIQISKERTTMKYIYTNATGTEEIEVDEEFYDILIAMDTEKYNSDRKHDRRNPMSLESSPFGGEWLEDKRAYATEAETAILWQQASASLTEMQRLCFVEVCLNGETERSFAKHIGLSHQAVHNHIAAARKKLKIFFQG